MPTAIDATVGGANSNSYLTLADANTYFGDRLYTTKWDDADDDTKTKALLQATKRLETEEYYGTKEDTTTPQKLSFPRVDIGELDGIDLDGTIPQQLKDAQCETALFMLSNDITQKDINIGSIKKERSKVGTLESEVEYVVDGNPVITSYNTLPTYIYDLLDGLSFNGGTGVLEVYR